MGPAERTIVEEHAAEAAFLWTQRDRAVDDFGYDLDALERLDERLEAHVDALRVAGEVGREVAEDAVDDAGTAFVAAVLAVERRDAAAVLACFDAAERSPQALRALVGASGWARERDTKSLWGPSLDSPNEVLRRLAWSSLAVHRIDPGDRWTVGLHDDDPLVRARAIRLVGELARPDLVGAVTLGLADDNDRCRLCAATAGALLGIASAAPTLLEFALDGGGLAREAAELAFRIATPVQSAAWLPRVAATGRGEVVVAALLGRATAEVVPALIEHMNDAVTARAAAAALHVVVGVDLEGEGLTRAPPEDAAPNADPLDERVALDADDAVPWPDGDAVRMWWSRQESLVASRGRLLCGDEVSRATFERVLARGNQRARAAASVERTLARRRCGLFEHRAPAWRQRRELAAMAAREASA